MNKQQFEHDLTLRISLQGLPKSRQIVCTQSGLQLFCVEKLEVRHRYRVNIYEVKKVVKCSVCPAAAGRGRTFGYF